MKILFTNPVLVKKATSTLLAGLLLLLATSTVNAQLGVYQFTGTGACPNQNPAVTSQPANAVFGNFTYTSPTGSCTPATDVFSTISTNNSNVLDPTDYFTFTITANAGYVLNADSLWFTHFAEFFQTGNSWYLRSSLDNYAANIATGSISNVMQTAKVNLPSVNFDNIAAVTFRIYVTKMQSGGKLTIDDVTLFGSSVGAPPDPGNPTSNSPQCANPGVTINPNSTPAPAGITWYWQTTATGTSTANPASSQTVTTSGTYYIRAQDNTSLVWSNGAGSTTVVITPDVVTPVFTLGTTSTRCIGAGTVTYSATAANNSGLTYSLDAASLTGGNTINASTGAVTYNPAWIGTSTITVSAQGCNGPKTATHIVTTNTAVATPVFTLGSSSFRCLGAGTVTYAATATNSTGITYSLDALSLAGGNTINSATGAVSYAALWVGTSTITATAAGCGGPTTATHTVTINAAVTTPSFTLGSSSTRCQGAGTVSYSATASNTSGITYSMDATSISAGNTINTTTGDVTYVASWSGTTTITASAAGCNGPKTATHTVTVTPTVGTPVFALGAASTRCQGAGTVLYFANASNNTGRTYTLDVTSTSAGNSINSSTGTVTYVAGWTGTSTITVSAAGCNGPTTAVHTATTTPTVTTPVFTLGATSTRCQGAGTVTYTATASNTTGITYTLNAASLSGGNSINSSNGAVTYAASWSGTSTITASAAGCNGPLTAIHTVTITPTVGTPVFTLGATSNRCQAAGTVTYSATATNNTGITYSLDATSTAAGNTINTATGDVTFVAGWTGASTITASATGCNGPKTANHTVTTNTIVGATSFTLGAASTRCQGAGTVTYTATAAYTTGITYSLDGASITGGNTINAGTGAVTYAAGWSGTTTITATAAGCSGPTTATHTVIITPTVGVPVFTLGATSTRCQGAGTVTYTATATNNTGITYSLDGASITAGNSIVAGTGAVTYVAGWSGTSTITASATGCNGPKTATHTVTVTPTVGIPVFAMGLESVLTQGATTVTYTATATNTTGITYSLDPSSLAGGNTINASTGAVTWAASWNGTSMITASAAGCNGPATASHIVTINASVVQTPLYLSDPGLILDRIDPVATGLATTVQTIDLSSAATTNITFTQTPVLCNDLVIKAQPISVLTYVSITSGTMPANPAITATIKYGATTVITLSNPIYNSATKLLTWTATLGADVTIPAGQSLALQFTTAQAGVVFKIEYHSATKPSRISLLPVSTFIDITSFNVYNAPYPGGSIRISGNPNTVYYARAVATTPFGYKDITGMTVNVNPPGTNVTATCVDSTSCTRTYEYAWTTNASTGNYFLMATAKEGYENNLKNSDLLNFIVCAVCAPVAVNDSATGSGGSPIIVDALANDYDPNNNIKASTLAIYTQANNGTAYLSNGKIVYLPNGSYAGKDTVTYQICDSTALCATGKIFFTINPFLVDPCAEATRSHTYYLPFSENEARIALDSSTNSAFPSNNIRTVISMKMPYPGMVIVWDHWEDGYESNPLNPLQSTTQVWGDGNPYNGIAPGYANDIIPAGGSIVLDNTIPTNPRVAANIFYDGRDKIYSSGQITVTQVSGEPSIMSVQCMKTNVSATADYGTSFTIPVGQDFNSQDFRYTSLFIRAAQNNTTVNIDKDNNGTLETTAVINEGEVMHVNGGVLSGATITSSAPIGVELHFGGNDSYSSRDVPIFPATWYYNTYYSPVPTTGRAQNPADTAAVLLYNSLSNRSLTINWASGIPSSGSITIPPKSVIRFPLALSQTAAYKFWNPTGESFTAIQICDSYTPGGGGNGGVEFDWAFNLIAQNRLTDFATVAWAPGSIDGTRNDNPVWVTPTNNTTIYVKYNGNISGNSGLLSPCGMRYDVSYPLNVLNHKRLLDLSDNDQSGLAVFTCDGTKLAAVYGEDASTAVTGNPSWDVGSTIQPFCKQKLIFANDDYSRTIINQPVTIPILLNDFGFLAVIDPTSVSTLGLLQPKHGTVFINPNGTILYTPNPGYVGKDTFEYSVCSTPTPIVCDNATVYVDIAVCPAPFNENVIAGTVYLDRNGDGVNNDGGTGVAGAKVYLYADGNCNTTIDANELKDSVTTDISGTYQFITYPEKFVADDFDGAGGTSSCASGSDGNSTWLSNWTDAGDPSTGFCNNGQSAANTDAEIVKNGAFTYALRLKDKNVSATRTLNLSGAAYAFLTFSYQRKSATLTAGEDVIVQASSNGSTFNTVYTIAGDGTTDAGYVTIYNQDITAYAAATTYIRFLTNNNVDDADTVYIDDVKVQFIRYPQCYITKLDASTVPANYHTTTTIQHGFTATSMATCLSPYDFGIAKNTISLSGTLYNDANAVTDNMINGPAIGTVSGAPVYAYLVDTSGNVAYKTTVNAADGTYSFATVDVLSSYTIQLSTTNVAVGALPPSSASLSGVWVTVGDSYGVNNMAGTGIKSGTATASVTVNTGTTNITGVNFGIERLPDSDDRFISYANNTPGVQYDITGGLTGSDPEDGILGPGKTYKITQLPSAAVLFYNGVVVTLNQVIPSFNPALLKIDPNNGVVVTNFKYASMDAANLFDPTPATVTITWTIPLPVILTSFTGKANNCDAILQWVTSQEVNTDKFIIEQSYDGTGFSKVYEIKASNNPTGKSYQVSLAQSTGISYYRLKIVDKDGSFSYSGVIVIRTSCTNRDYMTVYPNPVSYFLTVSFQTSYRGNATVMVENAIGQKLYNASVNVNAPANIVNLDMSPYVSGVYMIYLIDNKGNTLGKVQKIIKQ